MLEATVAQLVQDKFYYLSKQEELREELQTLAANVGVAFRTVNGRQLVPIVAIEKNKFKQ